MQPISSLRHIASDADTLQVEDRHGTPLSVTYQNRWNRFDTLPLYAMPQLLVDAFVLSEDKRFYDHGGVDWKGRAGALWQALHGGDVRGASSIPEQVVRMLHPRPRNIWSKWLEGWEAERLSAHYSKQEILEFYLNQLPYAAERRGVVQAARYYFNRDLATLSPKEMLALVVLARAPSAYDLYSHEGKIDGAIWRLAQSLHDAGELDDAALARIKESDFTLELPGLPVDASHFVRSLRLRETPHASDTRIRTTLDAPLQRTVQQLLEDRLRQLDRKKVHQAAALVVDHDTGEVLAWAVAGDTDIDAVSAPRQPGSAMKPFLYAAALAKGWTPASIIEDAPISEAIGSGLHRFRNYSHQYYGPVSLREALGNSLNTPALRAVNFVTPPAYLALLHKLGFASLTRGADIYDEGLALGAGEVTLFELVQGYTALAHRGIFRPLRLTFSDAPQPAPVQVFSYDVASLIGNILSDPHAREREFGKASIMNLPVQTAVKTGTSSDYRDAWAVGYNYHYVVGVWMGNLDREAMDGVTGSTGPALSLRAIFAELTRLEKTRPLPLSPALERHDMCIESDDSKPCSTRSEYFVAGTYARAAAPTESTDALELIQPTEHLQLALDPRVPPALQRFRFALRGVKPGERVRWVLDDALLNESEAAEYDWALTRGEHTLAVRVVHDDGSTRALPVVHFKVK